MTVQFSIKCNYLRHVQAFLLSDLSKFATVYSNGTIHQIFLLFFTRAYRHPLNPKRISIVSLIFKICGGIHGDVAHLGLPFIDRHRILDIDKVPRSFPLFDVETLLQVWLIRVLHAFFIDLVDAIIDVAMHEALHFVISTTLVQILLSIYFILRGLLAVDNLFRHIFLKRHPLYKWTTFIVIR